MFYLKLILIRNKIVSTKKCQEGIKVKGTNIEINIVTNVDRGTNVNNMSSNRGD